MRAHVFVVDQHTFPVHRDRCFCGIGHMERQFDSYEELSTVMLTRGGSGYRGMVVDVLGTRPGDLVFFYERQVGFHGVYEISGEPFFDNTVIDGIGESRGQAVQRNICLRVPIHCKYHFAEPVPEDMLFATPERETLFWVWFYRKIQIRGARGCTAIDPFAAQALSELLVKVNEQTTRSPPSEPYPDSAKYPLSLPLGEEPVARYEDILRGWLIKNIDDPCRSDVRSIFGPVEDLEWFANNVPYHVAGRNIDVLAFHRTDCYFNAPIRYRYSVVELKRDRATDRDIEQLLGYSRWVASRLAGGEVDIIRPILIAHGFHEQAIDKARHSEWKILAIDYEVGHNDIALHSV